MNIRRQNWLLSRRHMLRGLGVSLALPWLDCMRPLRVAGAEVAARPRRSVFIYLPNGVNTLDYQITDQGENYAFSKTLAPLEKHRSIVTPISGLYHPHGLGHHHNCRSIWLTGAKIGSSMRNTISVDQLMAGVTAPQTRYSSLELAVQGASLAVNADGIALPATSSPSVVFRSLFTAPKDGIDKQRRGLQRRGSILDAVLDEARDLESELGSVDRGRLEQYLTSVREVEVRIDRADKWLDTPYPKIDPSAAANITKAVSLQLLGEYLRTMYDLIVLAFQTDMTRVVTFNTGEEGQGPPVPEIGITQARHALSHHNGNPELLRQLTESDTFNITQFGYFLDRLSEVRDADGPLIETTMALYGSGMAFGHSHGNANLPLVLAGGTKLGLKHGRHVDYNRGGKFAGYELAKPGNHYRICHQPVNSQAHLSNLLLTMAQKMGVETDRFSDSLANVSEIVA